MADSEENFNEADEFDDDASDEDYETEEENDYTEGEESEEDAEDAVAEDLNNAQEWAGRTTLPASTWEKLAEIVSRMSEERRNSLTILVLGRPLTGRSSTVNTILCEPSATIGPLRSDAGGTAAEVYVRTAGNFTLKVVDTPRLLLGDRVNTEAFRDIAAGLGSRKVDVVLYVDRLYSYRIDPLDKQLFSAVTNYFGAAIWKRTVLVLTGACSTPPEGYTFESYTLKRSAQLRSAMRAAGAARGAELPCAAIENHSRCRTAPDGDRLLLDDRPQLPTLMDTIVEAALEHSEGLTVKYRPYNPNRRNLWLVPFLLVAQWALKKYVLDPVIEADGWRGDRHGTYSPDVQKEEKRLMALRKSEAKAEEEKRKRFERAAKAAEERQGSALASQASKSSFKKVAYQDEGDEDDDDDE